MNNYNFSNKSRLNMSEQEVLTPDEQSSVSTMILFYIVAHIYHSVTLAERDKLMEFIDLVLKKFVHDDEDMVILKVFKDKAVGYDAARHLGGSLDHDEPPCSLHIAGDTIEFSELKDMQDEDICQVWSSVDEVTGARDTSSCKLLTFLNILHRVTGMGWLFVQIVSQLASRVGSGLVKKDVPMSIDTTVARHKKYRRIDSNIKDQLAERDPGRPVASIYQAIGPKAASADWLPNLLLGYWLAMRQAMYSAKAISMAVDGSRVAKKELLCACVMNTSSSSKPVGWAPPQDSSNFPKFKSKAHSAENTFSEGRGALRRWHFEG